MTTPRAATADMVPAVAATADNSTAAPAAVAATTDNSSAAPAAVAATADNSSAAPAAVAATADNSSAAPASVAATADKSVEAAALEARLDEAKAGVAAAEAEMAKAEAAVDLVRAQRKDLSELKSLKSPPTIIIVGLRAFCQLRPFGDTNGEEKLTEWSDFKKVVGDVNKFIKSMQTFDNRSLKQSHVKAFWRVIGSIPTDSCPKGCDREHIDELVSLARHKSTSIAAVFTWASCQVRIVEARSAVLMRQESVKTISAALKEILEQDGASLDEFAAAERALEQISNAELAEQVGTLQDAACAARFAGEATKADEAFASLGSLAKGESTRLGGLIATVMAKYKSLSERWKCVEAIADEKLEANTQALPKGCDDPKKVGDTDAVRVLLACAYREDGPFRAGVAAVVTALNGASDAAEVAEQFGIESAQEAWPLPLRDPTGRLCLDKQRPDVVVVCQFGPPKGLGRALEKPLGSLKDLNRATFECEDPYVMALLLALLRKVFKVVGVKNKHLQQTFEQPPDLHVNLQLNGGWVVEVQLILKSFLEIKQTLHKYYQLTRAASVDVVLEPVFSRPKGTPDVVPSKAVSTGTGLGAAGGGGGAGSGQLRELVQSRKENEELSARVRELEKALAEKAAT